MENTNTIYLKQQNFGLFKEQTRLFVIQQNFSDIVDLLLAKKMLVIHYCFGLLVLVYSNGIDFHSKSLRIYS